MFFALFTQLSWNHDPALLSERFDVVVVPGCPSEDDGTVSTCQWQRARWAAELFHAGVAANVVVSGGAVYNPYNEADGLAAALEYLSVPSERIVRERSARHTDENAANSLALIQERGWESVAVASHGPHAVLVDKMMTEWGTEAFAIPLMGQVRDAAPRIELEPVADWRSPEEVDAERSKPAASLPTYLWRAVTSPVLTHAPPSR